MSAASEAQPVDAAGDAGSVAGGPIIETLDVAKHFSAGARVPGQGRGSKPTLKAVDGVSLAIRRGETLALVGETGSGKTTFGRLLLGLYRPTSGDIRYRGTSILDRKSHCPADQPAHRGALPGPGDRAGADRGGLRRAAASLHPGPGARGAPPDHAAEDDQARAHR